ncbi:hypothetical protein [Desertivirga xinjiangensis]|uniref:hypothetical protein n=1 Tax=Desertivirga xinjiangensis TaxID=539206 RepID=UPI00210AE198|nr:hypothetical protein [Pedobacter xinjiangensis]
MAFVVGALVSASCNKHENAPADNSSDEISSSSRSTSKVSVAAGAFLLPAFPDTQ